jgi:hypothetical protein
MYKNSEVLTYEWIKTGGRSHLVSGVTEMFVPVLLTRAIRAAVPVVVKQVQ